jgi:hypothetical protein
MKTRASLVTMILAFQLAGCIGAETTTDDGMNYEEQADPVQMEELDAAQAPKHCVIEATAVSIDQDEVRPPTRAPRCFQTFSQAIDFATGGRVQLPLDAVPEELNDAVLGSGKITPQSTYVIGIEYTATNFLGSSYVFSTSVSCAGGYAIGTSSMPVGWNNVISSAKAYSGCNHSYHYESPDYGGAVMDCGTGCSDIGDAMDDRTSSIRWTP